MPSNCMASSEVFFKLADSSGQAPGVGALYTGIATVYCSDFWSRLKNSLTPLVKTHVNVGA